jgi:hypothetical protein
MLRPPSRPGAAGSLARVVPPQMPVVIPCQVSAPDSA